MKKTLALRLNLLLTLLGGSIALWSLLREPSESQAAIILGFSLPRLLILFVIVCALSISLFLCYRSFRPDFWESRPGRLLYRAFTGKKLPTFLLFVFLALYFSIFTTDQKLAGLASYRARLYPLLIWLEALVAQLLATIFILRARVTGFFSLHRETFTKTLLVFTVLGVLVLFIAISKVGLTPDVVYWQEAGVPLLFEQVLLAWGVGAGFYVLLNGLKNVPSKITFPLSKKLSLDLILAVVIWGTAGVVWLLQPHKYSYNFLEPKAPNFQSYPFGDSIYYDIQAQYYLIGVPLPSHFWVKPLYTFFLALLHILAGQDFDLVVRLQVLTLAVIPALVYLLVSAMGNRPAGVVAALLVILRERNGIALSNIIQVTNSRLLMSDVFSMGLMVLLVWLLIRWLKHPASYPMTPLATGGALGLLVLTRGHPIVLLPFVIFVVLLVYFRKRPRLWGKELILLCLGMLLPLAPWFWRNYQQTGKVTLQDPPVTYLGQMANLYSENPSVGHGNLRPGESVSDFQARIQKQMIAYILQHPQDIMRFVSAHYFHNLIFSYIYLPQSFHVLGLRSYVKNLPFWEGWQGDLSGEAYILLVLNLVILSTGCVTLWKKEGTLAFAPLILALGYNLSVAVSRLSGWRFILPFDWIVALYYSVGLIQLTGFGYSLIFGQGEKIGISSMEGTLPPFRWKWQPVAVSLAFLMIGWGVTNGHVLFPYRYPEKAREELLSVYLHALDKLPNSLSEHSLKQFLLQDEAVIAYGRALYPSYLSVDEGAWNIFWPVFKQNTYERIAFHMIGPEDLGVLLPLDNIPDPASMTFPDGADVVVIGCREKTDYVDYIDALAVAVVTPPEVIYVRSPLPNLACPFSVP